MYRFSSIQRLSLSIAIVLITRTSIAAKEPVANQTVINSEVTVTERGLLHEDYSVNVDLGTLPVNDNFKYVLKLKNTTAKPFNLTDVAQSCNCISVEVEKRPYDTGETIPIRLSVSTSNRSIGTQVVQTLNLFEKTIGSSRVIPITITFKLSGVLSFTQDMYVISIPEQPTEHDVSIPFLISAPIQLSRLAFKSDANNLIINPRFERGKTPETGQLIFKVSGQSLNGPSESITIQMHEQDNLKSDSTNLVIQRSSLFDVAPSVLRFKNTENEDEYQAVCIIVRRGNTKSDPESQKNITVEASLDGRALKTTISRTTAHMARVIITADKSVLDQTDSQVVNWSLFGPEGKASVSTSFIFEKE